MCHFFFFLYHCALDTVVVQTTIKLEGVVRLSCAPFAPRVVDSRVPHLRHTFKGDFSDDS